MRFGGYPMQRWRAICFAGISLASLIAVPGNAAELPLGASTQWQGFYVGGELGGAWGETDWRYANSNWFNTLGPVVVGRNFDLDGEGFLGGGQVGFNFQSGAWVFGVEGSVAGTDLDETRRSPFFPTLDVYSAEIDWLTTVTGRVGYARDRWLAYAKAGWAGADVDLTLTDTVTPLTASSSRWADGWTVGGGLEYDLAHGFSLGVEYDYVDLDTGTSSVRCPACPGGVGGGVPIVDGDVTLQSVTGRLNYRFGK
jgi:outer membrane immunogenic protein